MVAWIYDLMISSGWNEMVSEIVSNTVVFLFVTIVSVLAYVIVRKILLKLLRVIILRSRSKWDDLLIEHKLIEKLAIIVPALVLYSLSDMLAQGQIWLKRFAFCMIVYGVLRTIDKLLSVINELYKKTEASKTRSIKGFLQILKIIIYAVGVIVIISILMDRSPALLLGGIGAASAVLLLIFQNTILGFVASIQLTENDMIRIGDWIEMPSHNADGDVVEISLHTVKVVNWDKTVTTIPTQAMINESFKNWRNMFELGGRRIKRCIYIDMSSVRFCDEEMLTRYQKIQYIRQYLEDKTREIQTYNKENNIDYSSLVNGRRLTNLGTFRAYLKAYLENHSKVHRDLIMTVRHLAPTEHGLPIEIYAFTNTTKWLEYESIQADIFDHIFAIVPEFDLRIFQTPTGHDFKQGFFANPAQK